MNDFLERVREVASISEVIGERIAVQKKGGRLLGLCPFHNDKNPSLTISEPKQLFKCFSCGMGGDIFKFVMEFDKVDFPTALRRLARKYGVAIPERMEFKGAPLADPHLSVKELNRFVAKLYHNYLFKAAKAQPARDYLRRRRVSKELLLRFEIGYAAASGDFLSHFFAEKKRGESSNRRVKPSASSILEPHFEPATLQRAQLFQLPNYPGALTRDFFRGRLMFPIKNERGEVLGFGGRTLTAQLPKYLNSKELPWFKKGQLLYGFREAYQLLLKEKQVYVVEGYFDVLACQALNLPAVAPLGTALTSFHLKKLRRYVKEVHLFFDGDEAGRKAAFRSAVDLIKEEMDGSVLLFSQGDPFEILAGKTRAQALTLFKSQAVNIYDFVIQFVQPTPNPSPAKQKSAFEELLLVYREIKGAVVKQAFGAKLQAVFNLSPAIEVQKLKSVAKARAASPPPSSQQKKKQSRLLKKELDFALFLCHFPRFTKASFSVISPSDFQGKLARYLFSKLIHYPNPEALKALQLLELMPSSIADFLLKHLSRGWNFLDPTIGLKDRPTPEQLQAEFSQRLCDLKYVYLQREKRHLKERISQLEPKGAPPTEDHLMQEVQKKISLLQEKILVLKQEEKHLRDFLMGG